MYRNAIVALFAPVLACALVGCKTGEDVYDGAVTGVGGAFVVADAPVGAVGGVFSVNETVTKDHTPVPGNRNFGSYWWSRAEATMHNIRFAGQTAKYLFLNTNSDLPPYETIGNRWQTDLTTFHRTFDHFLFNFNWDDPYIH